MSKYYGMLKVEDEHSDVGKNVVRLFEKLRKKSEEESNKSNKVRFDPRLDEYDDESYFRQLQRDAMKSLHVGDEVVKTEEGFVVT